MDRVVLHSDCNNFYASVECAFDPSLRDKPVAVCGDPDKRHGIVLAKNQIAKNYNVCTGEPIWQARQKCAPLVVVPAHFERYLAFSRSVRAVYARYTDQVESFGLDECWLDVTGSRALFGGGEQIATEIRELVRAELGITVSVGVSFNKVFAKLGSDMKKPDATTCITRENFRDKIWRLPASDLLYVGRATTRALRAMGVYTIGDIAQADCRSLEYSLGKMGRTIWSYANGLDSSPVSGIEESSLIKSIGNSTTTPRDLTGAEDVRILFYAIAEGITEKLRRYGFRCSTVTISLRDTGLRWIERQAGLRRPTCVTREIVEAAMELYRSSWSERDPLRSIGIRASGLMYEDSPQLSIYPEAVRAQREERVEEAVDRVRGKYGHEAICRGLAFTDRTLSGFRPLDRIVTLP